jgi:hypothetical protein
MGCWPGVKVASLASCVFVLGGCEPQTDDHCPPGGYYVDNGVEREYSVCDSGGGIGDVSSACQGIEDSFGLVVELAEGAAEIIDVFATDGGAIVVTREGVTLFARSGERLARQRDLEIDTAAFDGMHLVVSTETMLISYDSSLREIARGTLTAQCSASVMISGNRFVCGGTEESNRTFYVYDALTGLLVLSTHTTFAEEGPMRRVTGRDAFVSVSGYFGTFLLFGVDAMGVVRATANSRSGDPSYRISPVYAFAQDPATHLITDQGVLLLPHSRGLQRSDPRPATRRRHRTSV